MTSHGDSQHSPIICYKDSITLSLNQTTQPTQAVSSSAITASEPSSQVADVFHDRGNHLSSIFNFGFSSKQPKITEKQDSNTLASIPVNTSSKELDHVPASAPFSGNNILAKSSQLMLLPSINSKSSKAAGETSLSGKTKNEKSDQTLQYLTLGRLECKIEEIKTMIATSQNTKKRSTEKQPKVVHLASVECMTEAVSEASCATQTETAAVRSYCDASAQTDPVIADEPTLTNTNGLRKTAEIVSSSSESSAASSNVSGNSNTSLEQPLPPIDQAKQNAGQAKKRRLLDIDLENLSFLDNDGDGPNQGLVHDGFDNSAVLAKIKNKAKRTTASQHPTQL